MHPECGRQGACNGIWSDQCSMSETWGLRRAKYPTSYVPAFCMPPWVPDCIYMHLSYACVFLSDNVSVQACSILYGRQPTYNRHISDIIIKTVYRQQNRHIPHASLFPIPVTETRTAPTCHPPPHPCHRDKDSSHMPPSSPSLSQRQGQLPHATLLPIPVTETRTAPTCHPPPHPCHRDKDSSHMPPSSPSLPQRQG